jgi:lipoyl(octanoyl) transferase
MRGFEVLDLGNLSYPDALQKQLEVLSDVQTGQRNHTLLLVEHKPVLTLGASFHSENLLYSKDWYEARGISLVESDRGGDVTYHGPGQLVAYPIFDVAKLGKDLHLWMRQLEECVILALQLFDIQGERLDVNSGVWVNHQKICAIGIKIKRWVSMHGIAINCNNDLEPFGLIIPCGIKTYGVTSISRETGKVITIEDFKPILVQSFEQVFGAMTCS